MKLPPPATGVELYLAAVLEELRAFRVLLEDRALARFVDERIDEALGEVATAVRAAEQAAAPSPAVETAGSAPAATKRTRTRTRGGEAR